MKLIPFLLLLTAFAATASMAQAQSCFDIFEARSYPTSLKSIEVDGRSVYVHNSEIRDILEKKGVNKDSVQELSDLLIQNRTTEIPIDEQGFVAAANVGNHAGNYGNFIWFRDFARTVRGLAALPAVIQSLFQKTGDSLWTEKLASARSEARLAPTAMIRLLEDPQWTASALANIKDTNLHGGDAGQPLVIWIRRLLDPFRQNRPPSAEEREREARWGHKQNDALAAFAESVLDAVADGRLKLSDFSEQARENFLLLPAYFVRLQYAKMWDVGAWEEQSASRTSSIAMVTEFMLRFQAGYFHTAKAGEIGPDEQRFYDGLRDEVLPRMTGRLEDKATAQFITESLSEKTLGEAVQQAIDVVLARLNGDRVIETMNDVTITRHEDTALLHILWSPWSSRFIPDSLKLKLIDDLQTLRRDSGYARYVDDWFLYGGGEAAKNFAALGLTGSWLIPDGQGGWRVATAEDAAAIAALHQQQMESKDMKPVTDKTGPGLEAQWTLPDAYLTQFFAQLYLRTKDPAHLQQAKYHFARLMGLVTGHGETNSEGQPVEPFRMPEAYIPIRVVVDGQVQTRYVVSPNSPLNWAIAEQNMALAWMLLIL